MATTANTMKLTTSASRSLMSRTLHHLPRSHLSPRPSSLIVVRHASTANPSKPRVLEQPTRFNPPSHPARLRKQPRAYPGAPLSEHEREAQKTRQYPHMMPPEGSWLHWFLTNRAIHTWITLGVLTTLGFYALLLNFLSTTPYKSDLPPNNLFLSHPFRFMARYWDVYSMHTAYITAKTAERRKKSVDDVAKRSEYRKAHGLDQQEGVFGGWTAKTEAELMGPALREEGNEPNHSPVATEVPEVDGGKVGGNEGQFADFQGQPQPVKKWFGIW